MPAEGELTVARGEKADWWGWKYHLVEYFLLRNSLFGRKRTVQKRLGKDKVLFELFPQLGPIAALIPGEQEQQTKKFAFRTRYYIMLTESHSSSDRLSSENRPSLFLEGSVHLLQTDAQFLSN